MNATRSFKLAGLTALLAGTALAADAGAPLTLAISYFDINATDPELQVLKRGMADLLISDLAAVKTLRIVERARLNDLLDELKLAQSPFIDQTQAVRLGKGLSATHLLTGAILVRGKVMHMSARVLDVEQHLVVASRDVEGDTEQFFALEKELVELLVDALSLKPDLKEKSALRKSQTESYPSFKSYSLGLDLSDRKDEQGAREAFEAAARADPNYAAVKSALERMGKAVKAVEDKRARSLGEELRALSADDPRLYEKVERLSEPQGVGPDEREEAKLKVLEFCVSSGLRPAKSRYAGKMIGESPLSFWEAEELVSMISAFGREQQNVRAAPLLLEYVVRKYPDHPTLLARLRGEGRYLREALVKVDLSLPVPGYTGSRDSVDRHRRRQAFLALLASQVPLPAGLSRQPRESMDRTVELLAKEHRRRLAEFASEFDRRLKALDAADLKTLTEEVSDLSVIGQEYGRTYDEDPAEGVRRMVQVDLWLLEHPAARPYRCGDQEPCYLEESNLTRWLVRYDDDPDSWPLIPAVGEYLLKKFPDARGLTGILKRTAQTIEELQKNPAQARRAWADKVEFEREYGAAASVRALFKKAGEAGRRLK